MLKSLFGQSVTRWIKYSEYECVKAPDGELYIVPTTKAASFVYDPLENAENMIVEMLNIGRLCMSGEPDDVKITAELCRFAENYGLLGFMTALPTTSEFMNYETVYILKNRFITDESMSVDEYTSQFFPFDKEYKNIKPKRGYIAEDGSMRVSMAAREKPKAIDLCYQRGYSERYEWLKTQFKDWAFCFYSSLRYYEESDALMKELQRRAVAVFDGNMPTYHIELFDKPTISWNFNSLLVMIQLTLTLMMTEDNTLLHKCKHCSKVFMAARSNVLFCSPECKNKNAIYRKLQI